MARRSDHKREELHRMALDAASDIVAQDGLRGLSTRRIAKEIGYTAGTLYQLFEDLDDLIAQMNVNTLGALFDACTGVDYEAGPEPALQELAARYIRFIGEHPRLWNALFEHSLPDGKILSERHNSAVMKLLGLVETALAPLFPPGKEDRRHHEARVLWASLYGIASLAASQKLGKAETPEDMVASLASNYIAGLRAQCAG
jgi:AcrR family transcriptional regulator